MSGNVLKTREFQSEGDWICQILNQHCRARCSCDPDAIIALCGENNLELKKYPNVGMLRMNAGNRLRAAARRRHGLIINGKWVSAPDQFETNPEPTEDRHGNSLRVKKSSSKLKTSKK